MTDTERTHQPPPEAPQPLISRALTARSVLSFVFALAILTLFVTRLEINIDGIRSTIAEMDFWLYALAFLIYYCTFPLRGLRWQTILQNVGFSRKSGIKMPHLLGLSEIIYLGWFANCIIPVRLGDAYRGYQLKHGTGVSFSTTMGTILAERFIDMGVVVFLMLATSLLLATTGDNSSGIAGLIFSGGLVLLLIGTGGLGAMRMFRGQLHSVLPQRLQAFYLRFQEGTLGSFQRLPLVVGITLVVWLGESCRLFLVSNALGLGLTFHYAIFLALAGSLLTIIPFTPGGLGLVEAGLVGLLILAGVGKEVAVAMALLDRSITYWSIVVLGLPLFLYRRRV